MGSSLDAGAPEPLERDERPPTLVEFAAGLQKVMGPSHQVTIEYPEPSTDGEIKTKFFFASRRPNPDEQDSTGTTE